MTDKIYTWQEVGKHNTETDLWIVIGDYVYDVTDYQNQHPGGPIVFTSRAGRHASLAFEQAAHSDDAKNHKMPKYKIGKIDKDSTMEQWQKQAESSGGSLMAGAFFALIIIVIIFVLTQ